jgi:hypothetical protein
MSRGKGGYERATSKDRGSRVGGKQEDGGEQEEGRRRGDAADEAKARGCRSVEGQAVPVWGRCGRPGNLGHWRRVPDHGGPFSGHRCTRSTGGEPLFLRVRGGLRATVADSLRVGVIVKFRGLEGGWRAGFAK